jgi:hypothetical protein
MKARCLYLFTLSVSIGLFMLATSLEADIVETFPIDVDTYIDSRDPIFNYGVGTTAKVVVNGTDRSVARVLFRLPDSIWSISEGQLISAKIWFYVWMDRTADRAVTLHPLIRGFAEGTGDGTLSGDGATWQTYDGTNWWTFTGGDYDCRFFIDAVKSKNWFSWDITGLWNNADLRSFGAMLRMNDESDPGSSNMPRAPFTSSDGPANERPYVEVTYVDWLRADINSDGIIDFVDYSILASNWLLGEHYIGVDIAPPGGDGIVDALDLNEIALHWLETSDSDRL